MKQLLILCLLSILITSCARTINTSSDNLLLELTINISGNTSSVTPIYIVVMTPTSNVLPKNPTLDDYFILPGKLYDSNLLETYDENNRTTTFEQVNDFYQDIFYTWEQFIYISNSDTTLTSYASGDNITSSFFESTTTDNQTYEEDISFNDYTITKSSNKIIVSVDIDELELNLNDKRYIHILSLEKDTNSESGFIKDYLSSNQEITIEKFKGDTFEDSSAQDYSEESNVDIIDITSWSYTVY